MEIVNESATWSRKIIKRGRSRNLTCMDRRKREATMSHQKNSLADFMQGAHTLIENAIANPELAVVLAGYGYDAARLKEGRRLWAHVDELAKKQVANYGGQYEATQSYEKAWTAAHSAYMKTLKVARVAFGDDAGAVAALKLYGPRRLTIAGWMDQATTLYTNLSSDARFSAGLVRFGYSAAKLNVEKALIEDLRLEIQAHAQKTGGAQSTTATRDDKLRELDTWVSDFRTICRVAFYENPQELEKLGMMVLNGPRHAVKKVQAAV